MSTEELALTELFQEGNGNCDDDRDGEQRSEAPQKTQQKADQVPGRWMRLVVGPSRGGVWGRVQSGELGLDPFYFFSGARAVRAATT